MHPTEHIYPKVTSVTISSGQTTSAEVDLSNQVLVGIITPAALTGATFSFQASDVAGGTYVTVQSGGSTYSLTATTSAYIPIENFDILVGCRYLKIVSASSEASDRNIKFITRPL